MKKLFIFIVLLSPLFINAQQMNIISFNIRYNNSGDGENAWPHRIEMASALLRFHDADIFGLQEALIGQINDIEKQLPEYKWIGVGRDDGKDGGEFSPIFYNPSKFILLKNGTFWLSETPEKPSKGWDAALPRIVTWGRFQSKVTGKQFIVYNTHFDHRGVEARKNAATLIHKKIKEMTADKNLPVILTGDFNLDPNSEPIIMLKKYLKDSRDISVEPPYGPIGTFQGFDMSAELDISRKIDYIFVYGAIDVMKYGVLTDFKDHRFPSDHLPVFAKVVLK